MKGFCQNAEKDFGNLYVKANEVYQRESIDSAIVLLTKVISVAEEKHYTGQSKVSYCYNALGRCYTLKKKYPKANDYYTKGLKNARLYRHNESLVYALTGLSQLHYIIQYENADFPYKPPATTVSEVVSFPIEKVENITSDSCRITIAGGRFDGIKDSTYKGYVLTCYNKITKREGGTFIGNVKIINLGNNRTYATIKFNGAIPIVNDLVKLKAEVPVALSQSIFRNFILESVFWKSNDHERLFDRRFMYYFYDQLMEQEAFTLFNDQVKEVTSTLVSSKDTIGNGQYAAKITDGLFKGDNVIKAMLLADSAVYRLFLDYVIKHPENYAGNDFKFSEVFATWLLYKTPLVNDDAILYLVSIEDIDKRREVARRLYNQVEEGHLTNKWVDDAVQFTNLENIKDARQYARIVYDYGLANNSAKDVGWAFYIEGLCQNKLGNIDKADTILNNSLSYFKKANDEEGIIWINNTKALFKQKATPIVSVQTGHLLPFVLAVSPNPRYFATGSHDNTIKIWDIQLLREIKTIKAHNERINCIVYSPGGRYIVSSSEDSTVKIWNAYDYSLFRTIKVAKNVGRVTFSPDGTKLVCATRDSALTIYDPISGRQLFRSARLHASITDIVFNPQNPKLMAVSSRDSTIKLWNLDSLRAENFAYMKGFAFSLKWSNDGNYLAAFCADTLLRVLNITAGKWQYYYKINYLEEYSGTYMGTGSFSPDSRYLVFPGKGGHEVILDLVKNEDVSYDNTSFYLEGVNFANSGSYLIEHSFMEDPIRIVDFGSAGTSAFRSKLTSTQFKSFTTLPTALKFGSDSKSLYILTNDIKKFNFLSGLSELVTAQAQAVYNPDNHLVLSNNDQTTYKDRTINIDTPLLSSSAVVIYDYKRKKKLKELRIPSSTMIHTYTFAKNDSLCFIGSEKKTVTAFNVTSGKLIFSKSYGEKDENQILYSINADISHGVLYLNKGDGKVLVVDLANGAVRDSIYLPDLYGFAVTNKYIFATGNGGFLYKFDAENYKLIKKIQIIKEGTDIGPITLTPDSTRLVIAATNHLILFDIRSEKNIFTEPIDNYSVQTIAVSPDGKFIAVAMDDNMVTLHSLATGKLIGTIHTPANLDFVVTDTAGYYLAAKKSLDDIVFNYKGNSYGYEQFDVRYNRPDIILSEIGIADTNLIAAYKKAYLKRINKLGLTEADLAKEVHLPIVKILSKFNSKPTTSDSLIAVRIECSDAKYKLQSIHILVNNVPWFGSSGKDVSSLDTNSVSFVTNVVLSQGNNAIKVYCINKNGAASVKESFEIYCNKPKYKSKTYFVGIGVARYKDTKMNLTYPAKDIRDLAALFKKINPDVIIDTLINQQVTFGNILEVKKRLMKTSVDDKVIMAVTGHGLLSDNMDFYYATYDVDFKNPVGKGLQYQALEGLLNNIPARQKLLLIDACHSGELDKNIPVNISAKTGDQTIAYDSNSTKGAIVTVNKESERIQNSFELMQNLFVDLSDNNGTIVISATGGLEYAFESPVWKNGVFTYCVRAGIENKLADKDGGNDDGKVSVQELLQYLSRQVPLLTHGMQKPASRRENLEYDWEIR